MIWGLTPESEASMSSVCHVLSPSLLLLGLLFQITVAAPPVNASDGQAVAIRLHREDPSIVYTIAACNPHIWAARTKLAAQNTEENYPYVDLRLPAQPGQMLIFTWDMDPDYQGDDAEVRTIGLILKPQDFAQTLVFEFEPGIVSLGGKVVHVDLGMPGGAAWWNTADEKTRTEVRSLALSGDVAVDLPALETLKDSKELCLALPDSFSDEAAARLIDALIAAQPVGLLIRETDVEDAEDDPFEMLPYAKHIGRMSSLRSLVSPLLLGESLQRLSNLQELVYPHFYTPDTKLDIETIRSLNKVRALMVDKARSEMLAAVSQIPMLRSLQINECDGAIEDMIWAAPCKQLHSLGFVSCTVDSLAGVTRLRQLRELIVPGGVSAEDLALLAELPHLELLVLNNDTIEAQADTIAKLQAARPDLTVSTGLCLGSGWLAVMLVAALLAAFLIRRRRGRTAI